MMPFQSLRLKKFIATTAFLVVLSLVLSVVNTVGNAHAAADHDQKTSLHAHMDNDAGENAGHAHEVNGCLGACVPPEIKWAVFSEPAFMSIHKWIATNSIPAHMAFAPPRRPPQA